MADVYKDVLEHNVHELNQQYYEALTRIAELNHELFQLREAAGKLVAEANDGFVNDETILEVSRYL